jgi:cytochrome c553
MMKKSISLSVFFIAIMLVSAPSFANKEASVELGRKLFNNPGLGGSTNATSCSTCHQNGEKLQNAGQNPNLTAMINRCITGPLKGEALNEYTAEMESLRLYILSLGK